MSEIEIRKGELDVLFRPNSVAVMGASSDKKKIGGRPIFYLKHYNFEGDIYPINPNYDEIQGAKGVQVAFRCPGRRPAGADRLALCDGRRRGPGLCR